MEIHSTTTKLSAVLALGVAITASAPALARDPFEADYTGDCRPDLQCWVELRSTKAKGTYSVRYVAAARMDASKVLCAAHGTVQKTDLLQVLRGTFAKGQQLEIMTSQKGGIFVSNTDNSPCGKPLAVNGYYTFVGD